MGDAIDVLALLYDVHGNLPALEAVLDDAAAHGPERYGLGGDYALFGPFPVETVARLRESRIARCGGLFSHAATIDAAVPRLPQP